MPRNLEVDFRRIRPLPSPQEGFEEFCCQLARRVPTVPKDSMFLRFRGAGGDGGVECVWRLPSGEERGWQAKYLFKLDAKQLNESVATALDVHPELTQYTFCLPFNLTGPKKGPGGKVLKSGFDRYLELKASWETMAASRRMKVEFNLWDRSKLVDLLLDMDDSGGRTRFWFELEELSEDWFARQVAGAAEAAKPRYTPKLSVDVPISDAFEALGQTPLWSASLSALADRLEEAARDWAAVYMPSQHDSVGVEFPNAISDVAKRLYDGLLSLAQRSRTWLAAPRDARARAELVDASSGALHDTYECLGTLTEAFEAKHGEGKLDSPGWRQFMAEYQGQFPTHHVDTARKVQEVLEEFLDSLDGPQGRLATEPALLVTGPAGIGKTHSICDIGLDRHERGLRSIVLLGEHFVDGDPWEQIRGLLGLPGDLSREAMLAALEAAGEATGYPCVFFVDGLNETRPRNMWHRHLVRVLGDIRELDWVKLCISCRSTYQDEVIADNVQIVEVEHTGFEGVEFEAFRDFFAFYGLEVPSMPLLQPEFSNPLFLRLICEALQQGGMERLPEGILGITKLVDTVLEAKNRKISDELDRHPKDRLVYRAVEALVAEMAVQKQRWLSWERAREIIEAIHHSDSWSQSLFAALTRHNILTEDRIVDPASGSQDMVRLAFERLADHLIVRHLLDGVSDPTDTAFRPGGDLHFLFDPQDSSFGARGLLEALAVQLPERFGVELIEVAPDGADRALLVRETVNGISWRSPESLGPAAQQILLDTLAEEPALAFKSLEAILSVGTRVANPINADWMHNQLSKLTMAERDEFWCLFLHLTFGERRGVDRLMRWALEAESEPPAPDVTLLWLVQLAWFCAASDRRVRDTATMGMVRLLEGQPALCEDVLSKFDRVDDEYVIERVLLACYAALIRSGHLESLRRVAATIMPLFEKDTISKNAVIRDYARLIAELAHLRAVLPDESRIESARPPYSSEWPLDWPDKATVNRYKDSRRELPKLYASCMNDDFARYSVGHALREYDELDLEAARRWIFMRVLEMGYPGRLLGEFDGYLQGKYGGGRSRPAWAERIGKKYQWIALYRLIARVADHLQQNARNGEREKALVPSLQAPMERNLDPTVLVRQTLEADQPAWWVGAHYDHEPWVNESNEAWLTASDWLDSRLLLEATNPADGEPWLLLWTNLTWRKETQERHSYPRRIFRIYLRSYLVAKERGMRCWKWAGGQVPASQREPRPYQLYGGFVGEYPWGLMCVEAIEDALEYHNRSEPRLGPFPIEFAAAWLSTEHEFDSYHESAFSLTMPGPLLFDGTGIRWNGMSGYHTPDGVEALLDPSLVTPGPSALLVRSDFLRSFLDAHELGLVWTIVAEKVAIGESMGAEGIVEYSRSHLLLDGRLRHSRGKVGPRQP